MLQDLPELIYPLQFARSRRFLRGRVTLVEMHRLRPLLAAREGNVDVNFQFGPDNSDRLSIQGTVRADLYLICQRCLGAMLFHAESDVRLNLVSADDQMGCLVKHVSPGFELLVVVNDEAMALSDLVEDELLLALPIVPKHVDDICEVASRHLVTESVQNNRKKPFAMLGDLIERTE
uniref:Large ribosomal RNA subunit accumulation protein YceD n=1 Tax=Candidatus Kentrum sp. TUN TaxID=2126343 RepID=A0A450ZSC0_9GAMM|nr:MAG: uncharacterized protein BECKTUN1418D_GA0071000_10514 [Candidatus Kentron sp. TUN]